MSKFQRWMILAIVSSGLLLISVDMTVLYTALPTLTQDLDATASEKLWIVNAYPLVMAGLLLGAGTLGDRIGHQRMFTIGLVVFGLASTIAAFSPVPEVLIAARGLLAVGAAAMMPATLAIIRVTFDDPQDRSVAIGVWGGIASGGTALGPVVGGVLLEHFWWGSVFLINIPVVLLALVGSLLLVPRGTGNPNKPWDLVASVQVMIGLVGVVYAIKELTNPNGSPIAAVLAFLIGVTALTIFVRRQREQSHPLIDFSLFRDRRILIGVIVAGTTMFAMAGVDLVLTQRLQLVQELTPLEAGSLIAVLALASLVASFVAGGVLQRFGTRRVLVGGIGIASIGVASFALLANQQVLWLIPGLVVVGAGLGCALVAATSAIIGNAPADRAGMVSSIEEVSYELGSLMGVAVLGGLLSLLYTNLIDIPAGMGVTGKVTDSLDAARAEAATASPDTAARLLEAAIAAFDSSYVTVVVIGACVMAAVAFGAGVMLKGMPDQRGGVSH